MNTLLRRVALLCACIVAGIAIGAAGEYLFASSAGYLAVPVCVALAWLFVANPTQCAPPRKTDPRSAERLRPPD